MKGGVNISVAGGLSFGVAYTLDGAMHNDPQNNANLPMPFPDALQEFSVATSGLSAQNGMHSGASVNAVTKSGTNSLHGNAFEFVRDKRFNATDPFAAIGPDGERKDDGLVRNQFGGTLGGPIVRDKLFFFGGYQGTTRHARRRPTTSRTCRRPRCWPATSRTFASPACQGRRRRAAGAVRQQPHQSGALQSGGAEHGEAAADHDRSVRRDHLQHVRTTATRAGGLGRVDYQQSTNHSIFGRYMFKFVEEAAAVQPDVGERADDGTPRARQPGPVGGARRHDRVRLQRGQLAPRDLQPDVESTAARRSGSSRTTSARTSTATTRVRCP